MTGRETATKPKQFPLLASLGLEPGGQDTPKLICGIRS